MYRPLARMSVVAIAAISLQLTACGGEGDVGADRLEAISPGVSRDSLMHLIGNGPLTAQNADTMQLENGYRRSSYLIDGKQFEVIFFRQEPGAVTEPIKRSVETPIVLQDRQVLGWGWDYYAEAMRLYRLPAVADSATNTP